MQKKVKKSYRKLKNVKKKFDNNNSFYPPKVIEIFNTKIFSNLTFKEKFWRHPPNGQSRFGSLLIDAESVDIPC